MAAEHVQPESPVLSVTPLPASHWTVFEAVRWPGSPEDRIDEVVVGPSGVHVVRHLRATTDATTDAATGVPDGAVARAHAAAEAVARLLPGRYRPVLRPAICLCDTSDLAEVVGGVRVASRDPMRFAMRHQPRVLSTSEVAEISRRLELALTPYPAEPAPPAVRSLRRLWLRTAAAALTTAAAATLVLQVGHGRLW
jgi:hypothetical protein